MREDQIRTAIENMPGGPFERFARELVQRELYPGLNPTSATHDLGEDARTEASTLFMHNGKWVSVACSKTAELSKIKKDSDRCKETKRKIDIFVFVTSGNPRQDKIENWKKEIKGEYGWGLEVRTIEWLAPAASGPQHESLVEDYLHVPPPFSDPYATIEDAFTKETKQTVAGTRLEIAGLDKPIPRDECERIEEQLGLHQGVVLVGKAGTGKSGIGAMLSQEAMEQGKMVLFFDARRVDHVMSASDLSRHFGLNGPMDKATERMGKHKGCRVLIDQLDSIGSIQASDILVMFALQAKEQEGVEVVMILRENANPNSSEVAMVNRLVDGGFIRLTSFELSPKSARELLERLGINNPSENLLALSTNLLNLDLIGLLISQEPDFDFSNLSHRAELWESFFQTLLKREGTSRDRQLGDEVLKEAVNLAREALKSSESKLSLGLTLSLEIQRLISWGIIVPIDSIQYRFRHEEVQAFIYAWDAVMRAVMSQDVLRELPIFSTNTILVWMQELYRRHSPDDLYLQFLRSVFNV